MAYALAALSGVLYFLGHAGFGIWPLSLLALVPVLWALDPVHGSFSRAKLWGMGMSFGVVANVGGYYFVEGTLERFSGFPFYVCGLITLLLAAYQGLSLVMFTFLYYHGRRQGGGALLVTAAAMCVPEWAFPMLFKHYFGVSLHALPMILQIADIGGPLVVSALLCAINAGVYSAWRALRDNASRRKPFRFAEWAFREPAIALSLVLLALAYGAYRMAEVDARTAKAPIVHMGLVQANMGLLQKRQDPEEGLRRHIEQSLTLEREHPNALDLLIWPESAFAWFLPEGTRNVASLVLGDRITTPTLFGGLEARPGERGRRFFNTAFMTDAQGNITGSYDKTFLLPFGEYVPFAHEFPALQRMTPNSGRFSPGEHVRPLHLGKFRLGVVICYEDIFPSFVRSVIHEGNPHVLIEISNDAWFGDTHGPWYHMALAKLRSVEHHRALIRATNSGVSAAIDPVGRVVVQSKVFTRENLYVAVPMLEVSYAYNVLGDFLGPVSALILLALWWTHRRTLRRAIS